MSHDLITPTDAPTEPISRFSLTEWVMRWWAVIVVVAPICVTLGTTYVYAQFVKVGVPRSEFAEFQKSIADTQKAREEREKDVTKTLQNLNDSVISINQHLSSVDQNMSDIRQDIRELRRK